MSKEVTKALSYAQSILGTHYTWWTGTSKDREDIFYFDGPPTETELNKYGVNCAGLICLMRYAADSKKIHSTEKYRGGVGYWYQHFTLKNVLLPFDDEFDYPLGTLFLRKYRDVNDQGHVAVYLEKPTYRPANKPLYGKIIHAYSDDGVGISYLGRSHFWDGGGKGYYEYAILPENWL
jgi:hypothetical protein